MKRITFEKPSCSTFDEILTKRVNNYFRERNISRKANFHTWLKISSLIVLWLSTYFLLYTDPSPYIWFVLNYGLLGLLSALVIMNIGHDAAHNALSAKVWVNKVFSYSWNLLGISEYIWRLKHNVSHHYLTNIPGNDMDINQQGIIRLSPQQPLSAYHKYQHIYAPIIYMMFTLYLIFFIEFKLLKTKKIGSNKVYDHSRKQFLLILLTKFIYLLYILIIPAFFLEKTFLEVFFAFLCYHFVAGIFAALTFAPSHHAMGSKYVLPDKDQRIHKSWMKHQIEVTLDYAPLNKFVNWLTGGLNHHVVHHLFPGICHEHYPALTRIIIEEAKKYNITYVRRTWSEALKGHFQFLKLLGTQKNPDGILVESAQLAA